MFCTMASMLHLQDTKNRCVCNVHAHAHCLPLTTPPSTAAPPPPPHTIVGIDACHTQCGARAVCCEGRLAERAGGGPTGININCKHARRGPRSTAPFAPPALASVTRTPPQTHQAPNHTRGAREGAQRGSWGPGTLNLRAPFAKPRPLEESPQTALSSQHCLMLR